MHCSYTKQTKTENEQDTSWHINIDVNSSDDVDRKTEEAAINPAAMICEAVQNFMREFGVSHLSLRSYLCN